MYWLWRTTGKPGGQAVGYSNSPGWRFRGGLNQMWQKILDILLRQSQQYFLIGQL